MVYPLLDQKGMRWLQYLKLGLWGLFSFLPLLAYSRPLSTPIGDASLPTSQSAKLLCNLDGKSFIDNTEYFNKIMEGETLFGFHFAPRLTFLMAETMGLNLGFIWERHFGQTEPWKGIRPALSFYYSPPPVTFIIGVFTDHPTALLEPLYVMRKPFMEGLHFKLAKDKSYLSGWLNWLTLLSKKENKPETFTLHLEGAYCQGHAHKRVSCRIAFQLAVYHLGGQGISVKDYSLWCGAGGLSLDFPNSFSGPIQGASYFLWNSYIKAIDRPFKAGWGQLHKVDWPMPYLGVSLSYWYGHNFCSENMGHRLYQSIRIEDNKTAHYEPIRSLLFLSIYRDWRPHPGVMIQAVFRPYYDFKNRLLEYGFSCTFVYTHMVQLTTLHPISSAIDPFSKNRMLTH